MSQKKTNQKTSLVKSRFQIPRGMKDILPEEMPYWQWVFEKAKNLLEYYGFSRVETPILEKADLFYKGTGKQSDLVKKEMYLLKTKESGEILALRPEGTLPIARVYCQYGLFNKPQPVKLYYFGPFFRHEKPQLGRYREFYQLGWEIIGENSPVLDAQIINIGYNFLEEIGFKNKEILIYLNSLGCEKCQNNYLTALKKYYRPKLKKVCSNCRERYQKNPLRMLDCKDEKCLKIKKEAPSPLDFLCSDCKNHFQMVLDYLDSLKIDYYLDKNLVRGLDYYTRTVFEFNIKNHDSKMAIGGGGRYDGLLKSISRIDKPALGMAFGVERVIEALKERKISIPKKEPEIFLIQIGQPAKKEALKLIEVLRKNNIEVRENLAKENVKNQLEIANRLGVKYCLILGQEEINEGMVIFKDMTSGIQENLPIEGIEEFLKRRLKINNH
jgi:histidyl-tRNA synthetase